MARSRKPSMDLRAAAGGALGGLAAMIGFDALREKKNGLPPKDDPISAALGLSTDGTAAPTTSALPDAADSNTSVNTATPVAAREAITPTTDSGATLLPRRNRRTASKASILGDSPSEASAPTVVPAVVAVAAPVEPASELPYVVNDDAATERSAISTAVPAPHLPAALAVGVGGLAAEDLAATPDAGED